MERRAQLADSADGAACAVYLGHSYLGICGIDAAHSCDEAGWVGRLWLRMCRTNADVAPALDVVCGLGEEFSEELLQRVVARVLPEPSDSRGVPHGPNLSVGDVSEDVVKGLRLGETLAPQVELSYVGAANAVLNLRGERKALPEKAEKHVRLTFGSTFSDQLPLPLLRPGSQHVPDLQQVLGDWDVAPALDVVGRLGDDLGEELLQRVVARVLPEPADHLVYQPDQIVNLVAVLEAEQQGRDGAPSGEIITRKRALVQEIIARLGLPRSERRLRRKGDEACEIGLRVPSLVAVVEDDREHGR